MSNAIIINYCSSTYVRICSLLASIYFTVLCPSPSPEASPQSCSLMYSTYVSVGCPGDRYQGGGWMGSE